MSRIDMSFEQQDADLVSAALHEHAGTLRAAHESLVECDPDFPSDILDNIRRRSANAILIAQAISDRSRQAENLKLVAAE